ncbi:MAG: phosphatase PAP2 family protein, partial [Gemmatimonadota bacterium]
RARPTIILDGLASPGFASFPSGHTAKSVALYGLLTWFWIRASGSALERAIALLAFAGIISLVMFGRLRMGVHWPSDIIAGLLLGLVWLSALVLALWRAETASTDPTDRPRAPHSPRTGG